MIAAKPLNADDWRAYAYENGLTNKPVDFNDPTWAALTVEVARWYAVAAWANTAVSGRVIRYLNSLKVAAGYPGSLGADDNPSGDADLDAAMNAHAVWLEAGQPFLAGAIVNAEDGLRAEVRAAAWRQQTGTMERVFIETLDSVCIQRRENKVATRSPVSEVL